MMPKKLIVRPACKASAFVGKIAAHPQPNENDARMAARKRPSAPAPTPTPTATASTTTSPALLVTNNNTAPAGTSAVPAPRQVEWKSVAKPAMKTAQMAHDMRDDASIAANLPQIEKQRLDDYGQPYFRAWAPQINPADDGGRGGTSGYAGEDRMVVLVHFLRDSELEPQMPPEYMTFAQLKKMSTIRMREVPTAVMFGADMTFAEDAKSKAARLAEEKERREEDYVMSMDPDAKKKRRKALKPTKGSFSICWRNSWADCAAYDRFKAGFAMPKRLESWRPDVK